MAWLNKEAIDFVEISGGNYESSAMIGQSEDGRIESSTEKRELYFFDFAERISATATMPLMVTGGVTKKATAEMALAEAGVDLVGIARSFAYNPHLIADWKQDQNLEIPISVATWKDKGLTALATMAMTKQQLYRLGDGKAVKTRQNALFATITQQIKTARITKNYKAWLEKRG